MPGETLLAYLPQELALMIVLLLTGLVLLVLVGLRGIGDRNLSECFLWLFGILAIILIIFSIKGINQFQSESIFVKSTFIPPEITEQPFYSAALFVKDSFDKINNAGNKQDIIKIMPKIFGPNLPQSADFWWKVKVKYEIFGCEENIIDLYLEYYNRSDTFFNDKTNDSLTRNSLDLRDGEWIIIDAVEITGSSCTQVFP